MKPSFKVQARQWSCGRTVTCICGVVLRDHNDVIEFNSCNDLLKLDYSNPTPLQVRIRSNKCLSPGISIKNVIPGANAQYEVSPLLERHDMSSLQTLLLYQFPLPYTNAQCSMPGGGVLLEIIGRGVPPGSPNPDPISDQNRLFSTPVFQTWPVKSITGFRPDF